MVHSISHYRRTSRMKSLPVLVSWRVRSVLHSTLLQNLKWRVSWACLFYLFYDHNPLFYIFKQRPRQLTMKKWTFIVLASFSLKCVILHFQLEWKELKSWMRFGSRISFCRIAINWPLKKFVEKEKQKLFPNKLIIFVLGSSDYVASQSQPKY